MKSILQQPPAPLLSTAAGKPFPKDPVNLWPSVGIRDSNDENDEIDHRILLDALYGSCLPHQTPSHDASEACTEPENKQRVVLLQLPTVSGSVVESFVRDMLPKEYELIVTSNLQSLPDGWYLRPAIMPPLLEALDFFLQTAPAVATSEAAVASAASSLLLLSDVEHALHLILSWHCRVQQFLEAQHKAVMTVSLDEVMVFPKSTAESIREYVNVDHNNNNTNTNTDLHSSNGALTLLQRIDQASVWIERLDAATVTHTVHHILQSGWQSMVENQCQVSIVTASRLMEFFQSIITTGQWTKACQHYPDASVCQSSSTTTTTQKSIH